MRHFKAASVVFLEKLQFLFSGLFELIDACFSCVVAI